MSAFPLKGSDKSPHASSSWYLCVCVCVFVEILLQGSRFSLSLCVEVKGRSNSFLYCNLDQYWDMSGSVPGTWTGTDTPGEMSPINRDEYRSKTCSFANFKLWCYEWTWIEKLVLSVKCYYIFMLFNKQVCDVMIKQVLNLKLNIEIFF